MHSTIQERAGNITESNGCLDEFDSALLAYLNRTDSKQPVQSVNGGDTTPVKVSDQNSSNPQTGDKNDLVLILIVGMAALVVFLRLAYTAQSASKQEDY